MRVRTCTKALTLVPGLWLAGLTAHAQQQSSTPPSSRDQLADAARKAREEKKNAGKPKKVYTDDDVARAAPTATPATENQNPSNPPAGGTGASAGAGTATGVPNAPDAATQEDPNSEKVWRKRFQDQRDKIARAEKELDILQREMDKAQVEYYPDPQKALTEQNTRKDINEKTSKIAAKQQELAQLKQGLSDLEDQLRKAGGDPGWAK
jgi:hypothetical protein